eukprot:snap_masked-scaffold_3-processed-gene-2.22-mRNA-1 protein AED:1.00 eAED:1.00 QI:0/-1/0/0/-1/1/1/0/66
MEPNEHINEYHKDARSDSRAENQWNNNNLGYLHVTAVSWERRVHSVPEKIRGIIEVLQQKAGLCYL